MMRIVCLIVALLAATSSSAPALPGQSKSAVCSWAKHTPKLGGVQCDAGSEGEIAYVSATIRQPAWAAGAEPGYELTYESFPDGAGKIVREQIGYRHLLNKGGVAFDQTTGNGLKLLRIFYGDPLAADFASAKAVAEVRKHCIYRGRRFTYVVASYAELDQSQRIGEQKSIRNVFVVFPRDRVDAARSYASSMQAGV